MRTRGGGRKLPSNIVYETIHRLGGPTAAVRQLGVSDATLARWRRTGTIGSAQVVLRIVDLVGGSAAERLSLARRLAGLEE